jgi:hypothetical protein
MSFSSRLADGGLVRGPGTGPRWLARAPSC